MLHVRASLAALVLLAAARTPLGAQTRDIDLGSVVLTLSDSPTAQVFHIVDQLSQWDRYTHRAYLRWATRELLLTAEDSAMLGRHARLRRARGWGNGFEQAFLVHESIEAAAQRAIDTGLLSAQESAGEKAILQHFAPKVASLMQQQSPLLAEFRRRLTTERDRLRPIMDRIARFAGVTAKPRIPVFLVANAEPESGGGGANGGRLVVEVPSPDPMSFLLHEALHVLLAPHADLIRAAADSAGVSWETMNEAIAYAFAPGITADDRQEDPLAEQLVRFVRRGTPASDPYVQSYAMAIVIRPALRASLDGGESVGAFLQTAVERWRAMR